VWFGVSAAIGNAIAAGIVRTPGDIAQVLPKAWLFLGVWVVGGLYALFGASSLAELGAAIPRSGGQYNFSRRAIGEYAGFIVGWSDWLSTCGTAAAVGIVIAEYSGDLVPLLAGHVKAIAVSVILGFGVLQWRGIRWGSGAQILTAVVKTIAFLILLVACFALGGHARAVAAPVATPLPTMPVGWGLTVAVILGLQAVVYTIDGWDGVVYFGEEVRNPGRDVPRAIFGSVFTIMGIYLLLNAAVLYVLPMNEIAGNNFWPLWRSHHSLDHGDFHVELPQRQSAFLHANALRDELRRLIFPPSHESERGWHAHDCPAPQHHCRRVVCAGVV
jgi:basic amino acid/polyamine antiporter, APA family